MTAPGYPEKYDINKSLLIESDRFTRIMRWTLPYNIAFKKVQVGKDQEKAQSEKDSHSKNRGGKKTN